MSELSIKKANALVRNRRYSEALDIYETLARQNNFWAKMLENNIRFCRSRVDDRIEDAEHLMEIYERKKVLIADFRYPRYDASAGELATFGIIKIFVSLGYDVTFIPKESTDDDARYIKALENVGVRCIKNVTYDSFKDLILEVSKDISIAYIFRPDVAELCTSRIRSVNLNAFIFYHAPDVYYRRELAQYKIESAENTEDKSKLEKIDQLIVNEIEAAATADHVVCVSNGDALALEKALKDNALNKTGISPPTVSKFPILYIDRKAALPKYEETNGICFIGGSEHAPNKDAIRWFLDHVWMRLLEKNSNLVFGIIGKTSDEEANYYKNFPNVKVLGWIESIEDELLKYRISIAPLRFGAGIKGKVALSVMSGVPCVASTVAIEDMGFLENEEIVVADTADEYIDCIGKLIDDKVLWERLSVEGSKKADILYSEKSTFKRFIGILNETNNLDLNAYSIFIKKQAASKEVIEFSNVSKDKQLDVSIVVPGFNNVNLTKSCLESIYWSMPPGGELNYEIIYADDCSDEVVIPILRKKYKNLFFTKTDINKGYVGNSNNGVQSAKGRYIVLLNNDTIVLPDWLNSLYNVIEATEDCYVAGSKLLYANGKIQEAGAALWTDARTCNVGRGTDGFGLDRFLFEYNYLREVDYVSFASVIIKKEIWNLLGGLSQEYGYGYYDDSDFCLRVRKNGGVVVYAPESEVIHNESGTFSKKDKKLIYNEIKNNNITFRKKWADVLINDHIPYSDPLWDPGYGESVAKLNAARHNITPKGLSGSEAKPQRHILYFSPFPSHPASHGNQTTIQKFGQFLQSEGHAVHFVLLKSHMYTRQDALDMSAAWNSFDIIELSHFPSCNGDDIAFDGWYVPGLGQQIANYCIKYNIDTVICSYVFQSRLLEYVPRHILKIIDTHDKFTDRYSILDKLGKPREFFSCTRHEEGAYLSRADVVFARRDEEKIYFDSISTSKAYTVPHIEDRAYLQKGRRSLQVIGLVASCNQINLDIVISFINELIDQNPNAWSFDLNIAGEVKSLIKMDDPLQVRAVSHPNVTFLGFIEDIADFYDAVDLIVCPITSGTGINVKTVQALAYGMPLLATQHASKGIPTEVKTHLFKDVKTLVSYLLTTKLSSEELGNFANVSRGVYETYIDLGHQNFRDAISLSQLSIRNGVGLSKKTNLNTIFSYKYLINENIRLRKKQIEHENYIKKINIEREHVINAICKSLEDFGPTWININEQLPNLQSDGGVGYWFKFSSPIDLSAEIYLKIGGDIYQMHKSNDRMLTTSIPTHIFNEPKDLRIYIDFKYEWEQALPEASGSYLCSVTLVKQ